MTSALLMVRGAPRTEGAAPGPQDSARMRSLLEDVGLLTGRWESSSDSRGLQDPFHKAGGGPKLLFSSLRVVRSTKGIPVPTSGIRLRCSLVVSLGLGPAQPTQQKVSIIQLLSVLLGLSRQGGSHAAQSLRLRLLRATLASSWKRAC